MGKLNPEIPLNFRTAVFCFLMGTALSPLVGMVTAKCYAVRPPEEWYDVYQALVMATTLLLPVWSFTGVIDFKPLPVMGVLTFIFVILLFGLLNPAII
jgi:hypothetical protein